MWEQVQQALNQSMIRVLANELASLVPGLVALVIAVVALSTLIAGCACCTSFCGAP